MSPKMERRVGWAEEHRSHAPCRGRKQAGRSVIGALPCRCALEDEGRRDVDRGC